MKKNKNDTSIIVFSLIISIMGLNIALFSGLELFAKKALTIFFSISILLNIIFLIIFKFCKKQ